MAQVPEGDRTAIAFPDADVEDCEVCGDGGAMKIYVAGPYSAPTAREVQANVNRAIEVACALMCKGHFPYIPHLWHYVWLHPDGNFPYRHWVAQGYVWLEGCDALFYMAPSPGATPERDYAIAKGKAVYTSLDEVPDA